MSFLIYKTIKNFNVDIAKRRIAGTASTFEKPTEPDYDGDIFLPGAFDDVVAAVKAGEHKIKIRSQHVDAIGVCDEVESAPEGLRIAGNIAPKVQKADEALALYEAGVFDSLSIGFILKNPYSDIVTIDSEWPDGSYRRVWGYLKAWVVEVSMTDIPCNPNAKLDEVKAKKLSDNQYNLFNEAKAKALLEKMERTNALLKGIL